MHDLVHDLATMILADQVNYNGNACGNRYRYALLTDCSKPLQASVSSPANITTLHFLECGKLELHRDAFSLATCLHVLDLSECLIQMLPDSIGQLKQLRYLNAPRIKDRMIPDCITELSELNFLNLGGSYNISVLPESIGDIKGLMHLDLSGCGGMRELPISFAELKQLVHLDLSNCRMSISEALGGFTKLHYLNLSYDNSIEIKTMSGLPEVIRNLIKLRYLNLSGCLNDIRRSAENQSGSLLDTISTLPNIEHLDLSCNLEICGIPESFGNLRKLHTLDISGCYNLRKLPDSMVNMVSLKVLNMVNLVALKMDESMLSRFSFASLPHFKVHIYSHGCSSNIILLQPTNPDKLTIDRLENVRSTEEAQGIKLIEKENIKDLTFQWTVDAGRNLDDKEVLGKLVPPTSVKKLSISGYTSVSTPDWLGIGHYIPNLIEINLRDFPNFISLSPLGQLPNLHLLSLYRMEALEWNMGYTGGKEGANKLLFPRLGRLSMHQCAKLRIIPCLPARYMHLRIHDSDVLLSSWGESSSHSGAPSSCPVTTLTVWDSKLPLHQWRLLHHLPALRRLSIAGCSDLATSPEIIQHLSSVHSLVLNQPELPRLLVNLTSLQTQKLFNCEGMTSLPQWLGEFTSQDI